MKKAIIMAALAVLAASACADQLQFTGLNTDPGAHVTIDLSLDSVNYHVAAAKLNFDDLTTSTSLVTVCANLTQDLDGGAHSYSGSVIPTSGNAGLDLAARIVSASFASAVSVNQQAALQLAVWDAIYNNGASFDLSASAPHLQISNWDGAPSADQTAITADAVSYYNLGLAGTGSALYYQTTDKGGQSQLTAQAVPEPSAWIGLAAASCFLLKRRRRQI